MLNIVYLSYQAGYSFILDEVFQKWVKQLDKNLRITSIVIIDNFDTQRKSESCHWRNATVNLIAGDNTEREFSGYHKGLSALKAQNGLIILLNDTFLSEKHHPWKLLLPAITNACRKLQKGAPGRILGEINRGPIGAKFDDKSTSWLSTYCLLFSSNDLNAVQAAIQNSTNAFHHNEMRFNSIFMEHIDRQIAGLPSSKTPEARLRKFQATAAEMSLSRMLQASGLSIQSIYATSLSPWLFSKYTATRIRRKISFIKSDKAATRTWRISTKNDLLYPSQKGPSILTTVNADIYRILRKHPDLANILLEEKLCIDGRPLYYLSKIANPNLELIQGSSFIYDAAKHSAASGTAILILGGSKQANQEATTRLNERYGCSTYGLAPEEIVENTFQEAVEIITSHNVEFVFVCLGAPRQERFAIQLKARLPASSTVLIVGAGGTVDFAANRLQRAPKIFQKLALEGIYRLMKEPSKKRFMRLLTSLAGALLFASDLVRKKIQIRA